MRSPICRAACRTSRSSAAPPRPPSSCPSGASRTRVPRSASTACSSAARRSRSRERAAHVTPFGTLLHFAKDSDVAQPPVLLVAPHVGALLDAAARDRADDAARARRLPDRLAQRARGPRLRRRVRPRRLHGPPHRVPARDRPGRAHDRRLPAVRAGARRHRAHGRGRRSRPAAQPDAHGGARSTAASTRPRSTAWRSSTRSSGSSGTSISTVPMRFRGAGRRVYPGFVQLWSFMSMSPERHVKAFAGMWDDVAARRPREGRPRRAPSTRSTSRSSTSRPSSTSRRSTRSSSATSSRKGELEINGRRVDPAAIRDVALLTVEGERDNICGDRADLGRARAVHVAAPEAATRAPRARGRALRRVQRLALGARDLPAAAHDDPGQQLGLGQARRRRSRRAARGPLSPPRRGRGCTR